MQLFSWRLIISMKYLLKSLLNQPQWSALKARIEVVNSTGHLQGLRKTRGGIGSARFDSNQKTMDSFFKPAPKKRKLADAAE